MSDTDSAAERRKADARKFVERARVAPDEVRRHVNDAGRARAEAEYREFEECFGRGVCSVCGDRLDSFDAVRPCLHWLLVPAGFTKNHFMAVAREWGMFQLQLFLRRVANQGEFARNINDLSDEGTGKLVELTIQCSDLEWAFSCSEGDYQGHASESEASRVPHYHFQMRRKKQAFIRYRDFHVPLSESDIYTIEAKKLAPDAVFHRFAGGEGMSDLLNDEAVEHVVAHGQRVTEESDAMFKLDTVILADEGTTIDPRELEAIDAEAREKGVPFASLASRLKNVRVRTFVAPADGVVEQAPRTGGRGSARRR